MTQATKEICMECLREKIDLCTEKIEHFAQTHAAGDEWNIKILEKAREKFKTAYMDLEKEEVFKQWESIKDKIRKFENC